MANNGSSRWIKWLVIFLIVGGIAGVAVWRYMSHEDAGPQYQTAEIAKGDIVQAVTATGTLNPITNVTVGSQISGNIQKLFADFNSKVKANDVVAQLDPSTYQAAVSQAEGDLASAEATRELDQIEAKRADELFKSKLISESDHDTAIANLHQAEASVKIKQASLDTARVNLARCTIYSPVDGIVISRNVDVGQTVAASLSAPTLFVIANDLTKMEIDANVSEADVGGVEEKQEVNFTVDAFPTRTFYGSVLQVRNGATNYQNVVTYDTIIAVDNEDMKLKPGMTANVSIVIAERKDVVRVPNAALRFHPPEVMTKNTKSGAGGTNTAPGTNGTTVATTNGSGAGEGRNRQGGGRNRGGGQGGRQHGDHQPTRTVYVMTDKQDPTKLTPVQVKVGISDGVFTEVTEGLKEGDQVVTGLSYADQPAGGSQSNPFGGGRGGPGGGFRRM